MQIQACFEKDEEEGGRGRMREEEEEGERRGRRGWREGVSEGPGC